MIRLPALLLLSSLALPADEKQLSETDRQLLLERLEEIKNSSNATVEGRYQIALKAFRKGRASNDAAYDLFLDCVEKVRFEEKLRKSSEFRDWKRRHGDETDTPAFRLALRHQLNWLVLTIEAIHAEGGTTLASRAQSVIEAIIDDAETLKDHRELLETSVLQTVFARAYAITAEAPPAWPDTPLDLASLYEQLFLPPLRKENAVTALRQTWLKRIAQEGTLMENWSNPGTAERDRKPAFEKWRAERRPDLIWMMEVDLFRNGDQKKSSIRMLDHLKQHLTHSSAPDWINQFTNLVEGKGLPEAEPPAAE